MKSIPQLEQQRAHVKELFAKADAALAKGAITKAERDAYLTHEFESADEQQVLQKIERDLYQLHDGDGAVYTHKATVLITSFFVLMITLFSVLFTSTGGITGAVVLDIVEIGQSYAQDAQIPLALNATTRVSVSGTSVGLGDVTITLVHEGSSYEIYRFAHAGALTAHASLAKSQYAPDEQIAINASNVSSAYLMTADAAIPIDVTQPLSGLAVGEYAIKLIIDDEALTQEVLAFSVVEPETPAPSEQFSACGDACHLNLTGEAQLIITITQDASVAIDEVILGSGGNTAPQLTLVIPDMAGEQVAIDLAQHFTDADGDALFYSSTTYEGNNETIVDGVLTIDGIPGTYTYLAYASDLEELVSSNLFVVTITSPGVAQNASEEEPAVSVENETLNETAPVQNETAQPAPEMTLEELDPLNCNDPDPNRRHVDCLTIDSDTYFEEDVYLENVDRARVARVSAIGNLLLTGRVIQNDASGVAGSRDFTIGYKNGDFEYVPTVWIDGEGNLHLRGALHEENANLLPPPGSYTIMNRRGVFLAYADSTTGDLYVRGNVIPYRTGVSG